MGIQKIIFKMVSEINIMHSKFFKYVHVCILEFLDFKYVHILKQEGLKQNLQSLFF